MARCPECGHRLTLAKAPARWDHIYCGSCRAELEVLNTMPLELEAVFDFEDADLIAELVDELDQGDELEHDVTAWTQDDDGDSPDEAEAEEEEDDTDEEESDVDEDSEDEEEEVNVDTDAW